MSSPKPHRRWLQFRLRTLLFGVTLATLPLGYVAWEREQCHRGAESLDLLNQNAEINIVWLWREGNNRPYWLALILGDETFRHVDTAMLVSDSDLKLLVMLPNLTLVEIDATNVTDEGISHLRSLKSIEDLSVCSNKNLSHRSWEVVGRLGELHSLSLRGSRFGDEDVHNLRNLTNLRALDLSKTAITDNGLSSLSSLNGLSRLQLQGTQVSDAGLVYLKGLTNLRDVALGDTRVTLQGVQELKRSLPPGAYISRIQSENER